MIHGTTLLLLCHCVLKRIPHTNTTSPDGYATSSSAYQQSDHSSEHLCSSDRHYLHQSSPSHVEWPDSSLAAYEENESPLDLSWCQHDCNSGTLEDIFPSLTDGKPQNGGNVTNLNTMLDHRPTSHGIGSQRTAEEREAWSAFQQSDMDGQEGLEEWETYLSGEDLSSTSNEAPASSSQGQRKVMTLESNEQDQCHIGSAKPPRAPRMNPYWKTLRPKMIKTELIKKYMQVSNLSYELCRGRIRLRCDPTIRGDLMSGNPVREQRAVRSLDFPLGPEKVFTCSERVKLKEVLLNKLGMHPCTISNVLTYGIGSLPRDLKQDIAENGVPDEMTYIHLAQLLRDGYNIKHCQEVKHSQQRKAEWEAMLNRTL